MYIKFIPIIFILLLSSPAQASTIDELRKELRHCNLIVSKELSKVQNLIDNLSPQDKESLSKTYIGGENMTEQEILILGNDMSASGIEKFEFYLKHINKPIKKDAIGNQYR